MNTDRIAKAIDVPKLALMLVTIVGVGGGASLIRNLVRCGVRRFRLIDFDRVGEENICRQEVMIDQVGAFKVHSLADEMARINPEVEVQRYAFDFLTFDDDDVREYLGDTDLFIFATDTHAAQARGNQVALMLNKPAVFIGVYEGGIGGEVFFWRPGLASCHRCCCSGRYDAQEVDSFDPPSDSATVLDIGIVDSIAGHIIIGLLTAGADNRFGRLIEKLGDRQFLQVILDPDWTFDGENVVRRVLEIPESNDAFFSFCTAARRDPDPGGDCPDCRRFRKVRGLIPLPEGSVICGRGG